MGSPALLVGDVGGTNCRLARFDGQIRDVQVWSTDEVSTLGEAADRYLAVHRFTPDAAAVAVPSGAGAEGRERGSAGAARNPAVVQLPPSKAAFLRGRPVFPLYWCAPAGS